jgi:hypothetical protein
MSIIPCPSCTREFQLPPVSQGQRFKCPHCQMLMIATAQGVKPAPYEVGGKGAPSAAPRPRPPRREREDEDDYGGGSGSYLAWLLTGFLLTGLIAAGLLFGVRDRLFGGGSGSSSSDAFDSVKNGMTEDEVTKLLGEPTGIVNIRGGDPPRPSRVLMWEKGGTAIEVTFTDGKVESKKRETTDPGRGRGP